MRALCAGGGAAAQRAGEQPLSTKKSPGGGRMVASLSSTPTPRLTSQTKPTDGRTDENSLLALSLARSPAARAASQLHRIRLGGKKRTLFLPEVWDGWWGRRRQNKHFSLARIDSAPHSSNKSKLY